MKRTDFRPNNSSSSMSDKQRKEIKKSNSERKENWERIAGGYERNSKTGIVRATDKYGSFGKAHDEEVKRQKEQDDRKHYDKLDKQREKKRSLLIDKPNEISFAETKGKRLIGHAKDYDAYEDTKGNTYIYRTNNKNIKYSNDEKVYIKSLGQYGVVKGRVKSGEYKNGYKIQLPYHANGEYEIVHKKDLQKSI